MVGMELQSRVKDATVAADHSPSLPASVGRLRITLTAALNCFLRSTPFGGPAPLESIAHLEDLGSASGSGERVAVLLEEDTNMRKEVSLR